MSFSETLRTLLAGPEVAGISLILAIVSIVLAYIFYRKSIRLKEPKWAARGTVTIDQEDHPDYSRSELQIYFCGILVPVVSIDRFVFWNAGHETIHGVDVVAIDPLRFECNEDGNILDAKIIATNKNACGFNIAVSDDKRSARLDFDFCDYGNGVVIQLISSARMPLRLTGTIKGATPLRFANVAMASKSFAGSMLKPLLGKRLLFYIQKRVPVSSRFVRCVDLTFGFGLIGAAVLLILIAPKPSLISTLSIALAGGAYIFIGIMVVKYRLEALPKGLESFSDEPLTRSRRR